MNLERPPFVTVTPDPNNPSRAILNIYEAGSGSTIVKMNLSANECALLIDRLLIPVFYAARSDNKK